MKKKTTLFSVLVYTLKSNYLLFSYLIPPILLQTYGNSSYLASLACFLVVLLLVFLLPKNIGEINYLDRLNKSFLVKISYYLLQVCQTILFTLLVSYTVGRMFFNDTNILIFIIVSVAIVIYLSTNSVEVIFNSSTFLFIASTILILIPFFLTNEVKDYSLLKPFEIDFNFTFLLMLYFGLDIISIVFSGAKFDKKIKRKNIIIPISIFFLFITIEILNIILITGSSFMIDNEFLGFFSLFIQDTINYIGNLGIVYLFVIPVTGCYKAGYALRKIRDGFNINNKFLINIILSILLFFPVFFINRYFEVKVFTYYALIIMIALLMLLYFFILINRRPNYEIRF